MKYHLDGAEIINAPPEKTYSRLTDPNFMVGAVPDIQSYKVLDGDHFEAKIKVGISIVRGTIDMKFAILDKRDGNHAKLVADGSGAGSKMHIDSIIDLLPDPQGTKMVWSADVEVSGLMAGIGSQILKGQSEKQVSEIFTNVKQKIEAP
ncbi:MAG: carbon monoxide dehydrogenase subunit G [Nitrososphaerales archaeon]